MDGSQVLYATLPRRIKASIIDGVVLLALFILSPLLIGSLVGKDIGLNAIVMFAPPLLLEPFLITYLGFTLGQYIFGIQVIRLDSGGKCPLIASFGRYCTKAILGGLSMVYMLFSKKHQAIHDHLAKTLVVLSDEKIKRNPSFSEYGEREQTLEGDYSYPAAHKMFVFFLLWLIPVCIIYGFIIEGAALLMLPGYTFETEKLPKEMDIAIDLVGSLIFIALAILASKGYLPGAKRKMKTHKNNKHDSTS
jgi:uncharacterized RDD family membrane protein YckC